MRCLRCGHCCQSSLVTIVVDPARGVELDNLKAINTSEERCPHLRGSVPGEYSCAVHDEPWYPETPCWAHGQIERSPDDPCRMGEWILKRHKEGLDV